MKKINFKKLLSQMHLPKKKEYRTISGKGQHDWKILSISFLIVALLVIAGNTLLFLKVNNPETASDLSGTNVTSNTISQKNLENTVQFFQARATRLTELKLNKPNVTDPSL
jgi:hypothetical protein